MKTTEKLLSAFAVLLVGSVPLLAAPAKGSRVVFRVDPVTTLRGLPVAFLVALPEEVMERGLDHVDAVLHVVPDEGEPFQANYGGGDASEEGSVDLTETTVRGRIDFSLRTAALAGMVEVQETLSPPRGPDWFADERLQQPGTYRLRLQILAKELGMAKDLWSSEATLVISEPKGVDAEAWQWLHDHANGWKWSERSNVDVARKLIQTHPSSLYAMYVVGSFDGYQGDFTNWLAEAVELSKGTWLGDYYGLRLQGMRAGSGSPCMAPSFSGSPSERGACQIRVAMEVREQLRSAAAQTSSPLVRHLAESGQRRLNEQIEYLRAAKNDR